MQVTEHLRARTFPGHTPVTASRRMTHRNGEQFNVRRATPADAHVIAVHRANMFQDMGIITADTAPALVELSREYLDRAIPDSVYLGWLAFEASHPEQIVAGAGLLLRQ